MSGSSSERREWHIRDNYTRMYLGVLVRYNNIS